MTDRVKCFIPIVEHPLEFALICLQTEFEEMLEAIS